ncbi:unnamed protein product [Malus baccata var. baccata]
MEEDALQEVSFTALASKAFGGRFGAFVAVVHASLSFALLIAGNTVADARKAVLIGGAVPLIMVLSWNLIVLGLSGSGTNAAAPGDPISLLLSVNPSALQAFAFSALATSLIGYAVSFPKQLLDTVELIAKINLKNNKVGVASSQGNGFGRVGFAVYSK